MVLDGGRLVRCTLHQPDLLLTLFQAEFDTPLSLLKKSGGVLRSLVDESGDRATLYAMAEGKA